MAGMSMGGAKRLQQAGGVWNFDRRSANYHLIITDDKEVKKFLQEHERLTKQVMVFKQKWAQVYHDQGD